VGRSLFEKLGYRPGTPALLWSVPAALAGSLPPAAEGGEAPRWIMAFLRDRAALDAIAGSVLPAYHRGGWLWLAYPKRSGRIRSDLSRDRGWDVVTVTGLIGVAQIAVDADWSALRFRYQDEVPKLTRRTVPA
jgi:hypothetical protein